MELFRITRQKYERELSGNGAAIAGGRWNEVGKPVVYTASSRSLAILETLVHLRQPQPPPDYRLMVLFVPDTVVMTNIAVSQLSDNWKSDTVYTQQVGHQWLTMKESLLLRVPSVMVKAEYNYLLNPAHEQYKDIQLVAIEPIEFDPRFFQKVQ